MKRSSARIVRVGGSVKFWMFGNAPDVDAVRPAGCAGCCAPGRTATGCCNLHGHGKRVRQMLGPPDFGRAPALVEVTVRRYRCKLCRTMMMVTTAALLPRKHYGAAVIALALWFWAVRWLAAHRVRALLSPRKQVGHDAAFRWSSLARWARQACGGGLWRAVSTTLPADLRKQTERVMRQLAELGPAQLPDESRIWHAAHQAR